MRFTDRFDEIKWYLLACIVCFCCVPLLAVALPQYAGIVQMVSQFLNVAVVDVTSFLCGYNRFRWYYPLCVMLLFAAPALLGNLYTLESIYSNGMYYLILSFLAGGIGVIISKIRH